MNHVPAAFCDHVCHILSMNAMEAAEELSGYYGKVAQVQIENRVRYACGVENGQQEGAHLRYVASNGKVIAPNKVKAVRKKFVRCVWILLMDSKEETVSRELVRRFPYSQYNFVLYSPSINAAWVDVALSIKRLITIAIMTNLNNDEDALKLFEKLVKGQKLFTLVLYVQYYDRPIMKVLKTLLRQGQFEQLRLSNYYGEEWSGTPVLDLLRFWSKNSELLGGKNLMIDYWEEGVDQLEEFVLQRALAKDRALKDAEIQKALYFCSTMECDFTLLEPSTYKGRRVEIQDVLEVCSKEECEFIDKEYLHNHFTFIEPSRVYRFQEGQGAKRRRIYVSFECADEEKQPVRGELRLPARYSGLSDLSLLHNSRTVRLFFA
uniref:FBA_2 domain-containing protein n=1 Tax=Steinernema glaseri TaxID=37863 RepID=A0A1I7YHW5_9BILA